MKCILLTDNSQEYTWWGRACRFHCHNNLRRSTHLLIYEGCSPLPYTYHLTYSKWTWTRWLEGSMQCCPAKTVPLSLMLPEINMIHFWNRHWFGSFSGMIPSKRRNENLVPLSWNFLGFKASGSFPAGLPLLETGGGYGIVERSTHICPVIRCLQH